MEVKRARTATAPHRIERRPTILMKARIGLAKVNNTMRIPLIPVLIQIEHRHNPGRTIRTKARIDLAMMSNTTRIPPIPVLIPIERRHNRGHTIPTKARIDLATMRNTTGIPLIPVLTRNALIRTLDPTPNSRNHTQIDRSPIRTTKRMMGRRLMLMRMPGKATTTLRSSTMRILQTTLKQQTVGV